MDLQSIIVWIIVGAIAGIIADFSDQRDQPRINRKNHRGDHWRIPWRLDIFTAGDFIRHRDNLAQIIPATIGAIVILIILRLVRGRR